jgi:ribosomal protein S17E
MTIILTGEIKEEEIKLINAMHTISEYRDKYSDDGGFELLTKFLESIMEVTSKKHLCQKCGNEFKLHDIIR